MANEVEIVVNGRDNTGNLFSRIRQTISTQLRGASADVDREGRSMGSRLMESMSDGFKKSAGIITDTMRSVMSGSLQGSLATPVVGPIILAFGAAIATGIAPVVAAAIGGALILGLGAAFVGVGAMILLQNEKIKKEFTDTFSDIKDILSDAFAPLKPVLDTVRTVLKGLAEDFKPVIESASAMAKGPLQAFIKDLGKAFLELRPAVLAIMEAFNQVLGQIGPMLPMVFKDIADALIDLSRVVIENKGLIGTLFIVLLETIPVVIAGISNLLQFFRTLQSFVVGVFAAISGAVLGFADMFLNLIQTIIDTLSSLPLVGGVFKSIFGEASDAIQGARDKVQGWKADIEALPKTLELKADISDLESKISTALRQLEDPNLTKERRAEVTADITRLMMNQAMAVSKLNDPALTKTYTSRMETIITDLQAKIATAKKELQNPELTKTRQAELKAEIKSLQSSVAAAKNAINSVQGKTVTVTVRYTEEGRSVINGIPSSGAYDRARGGIIGAAGGGPRSSTTLVGEQGPEIVELPFGSKVIPANTTRNMIEQGGLGGGGGGLTVNVYVQGSIRSDRDLVKIIKDEFINGGFRGALNNA